MRPCVRACLRASHVRPMSVGGWLHAPRRLSHHDIIDERGLEWALYLRYQCELLVLFLVLFVVCVPSMILNIRMTNVRKMENATMYGKTGLLACSRGRISLHCQPAPAACRTGRLRCQLSRRAFAVVRELCAMCAGGG